ncbi:hypothetical protein [Cupriavidus sp. U2]|nr:hypothetical protein [Cupriavidus sp. U2]
MKIEDIRRNAFAMPVHNPAGSDVTPIEHRVGRAGDREVRAA